MFAIEEDAFGYHYMLFVIDLYCNMKFIID